MSAMAEVLAAHQWYDATTDNEDPATGCTGCPDWFGSEDALDDGAYAAHQAEMLTAAGFGPVKEAGAVALEEAADEMDAVIACGDVAEVAAPVEGSVGRPEAISNRDSLYEEPSYWLRAHAAAVRGEG